MVWILEGTNRSRQRCLGSMLACEVCKTEVCFGHPASCCCHIPLWQERNSEITLLCSNLYWIHLLHRISGENMPFVMNCYCKRDCTAETVVENASGKLYWWFDWCSVILSLFVSRLQGLQSMALYLITIHAGFCRNMQQYKQSSTPIGLGIRGMDRTLLFWNCAQQ